MENDLHKLAAGIRDTINHLTDKKAQSIHVQLLNLVEMLLAQNEEVKIENQKLKDEINRLKGEQGKPDIRKQTKSPENHSSETERENKKPPKRSRNKKSQVKVTRILEVDVTDNMPPDVICKGHESRVIQDI